MTHLPAALCAVLVVWLLWGEATRSPTRAVSKTGASLAFVAYAWTMDAASAGPPGVAVLVGLVLSAFGDVALLSRERRWFLTGLVSFLLAHVAYIVAFVLLGLHSAGVAALVPLGAVGFMVWRYLGSRAGDLARAVLAYMVVITVMVACASGTAATDPLGARGVLWLAAVLFYASDLCVARDRFVAPGVANRFVGLPLYYGAQLLFAGAIAGAAT